MILLSSTERLYATHLLSASERFAQHAQSMGIGFLIAQARRGKRLSQAALAEAIGVNKSAVAQWELGTTTPKGENMDAVRRLLEIEQVILPAPGSPYRGELVEDPDELALLKFWRGLDDEERSFMLKRLMSNPPPARKPPPRKG